MFNISTEWYKKMLSSDVKQVGSFLVTVSVTCPEFLLMVYVK